MNLESLGISSFDISGIIHIGAHYGEEIELYKSLYVSRVLLFEPLSIPFKILKSKKFGTCINKALGNFEGTITMNVSSIHDASSSILFPKIHLDQYPDTPFDRVETVQITTLDRFFEDNLFAQPFNLLNIDVQGYELEVFKGACNTLKNDIRFIFCEVNRDELYDKCALIEDIDSYLYSFGFVRKEVSWRGVIWGDAFYKKCDES